MASSISGRIFKEKDGNDWLVEIDGNIVTHGTSRPDAFFMAKDWYECKYDCTVSGIRTCSGNTFIIER